MHKGIAYSLEVFKVTFKALLFILLLPFKLLFGSSLKKKISNRRRWEESKRGSKYYRIRENFVVIVYQPDDEKDEDFNLDGFYKLLIKKDDDDYFVENWFEVEEDAIENAYSALKQLKLI